jgi:hypothetical protein
MEKPFYHLAAMHSLLAVRDVSAKIQNTVCYLSANGLGCQILISALSELNFCCNALSLPSLFLKMPTLNGLRWM